MGDVVYCSQSAFLKGGQITDSFLIANEWVVF